MDKNAFFQALSSPYRRDILWFLRGGEKSAGEIAQQFAVSQPAISRHLDILRRSGLVFSRREGNHILYSLNRAAADSSLPWLTELFEER